MEIQILDVDYILVDEKPILRIFGKTLEGESVCAFYSGYRPYFYVEGKGVKKFLENEPQVVKIENVKRNIVMGYQAPREMRKVIIKNPAKTPDLRERLKANGFVPYEADILFRYRFMNDLGLNGMEWVKMKSGPAATETVQADKKVEIKEMKPIKRIEDAPLKILALDIECAPLKKGMVPEAKKDPIILVSLVFDSEFKGSKHMSLSTRTGSGVTSCESEREMFEKFIEVIREYDPDIITGYNINNFDMPYILERMRENNVKPVFGRCNQKQANAKKLMARYRVSVIGRVVVDSFELVKKDFSLMRYNLGFVCDKLLDEKKKDVRLSEIEKLWRGSQKDFERLVEYSRQDSILAMNLLLKLNLVYKYIALSKISGTLLQDTLNSGETTRIENFLLREFNKEDYVFPCKPDQEEVSRRVGMRKKELKGGYVIEPEKTLHSNIVVFDFKSMYPSIIRTFNICPTTIIRDFMPGDPNHKSIKSPSGALFVAKELRYGIIPRILERLVKQRSSIKKRVDETEDVNLKRVLDAEQWALKIMANAFYGHMGYSRARIYDLDVANAVTSYGRDIIQKTKSFIEEKFDYRVVYGDTDSVMVKVPEEDLEKTRVIANGISEDITKQLPGVIELEFEKAFKRFLPLTKKRYVAWKFEPKGNVWEESIEMKGIETVRRDWCELVSDVMKEVIDLIVKMDSVKEATHYFGGVVNKLLVGEIPIQKLVITKTMTKLPDHYAGMQPHIELVKKIRTRSPGDAPGIGDRIGYVIVKGTGLLSKRAEDPVFVVEKGLQTDSKYYIENQLLPPVERIFGALGISKSELLGNGKQTDIMHILNNQKQKTLKELPIDQVNGFVCMKCNKFYPRTPLVGNCSCGGSLMFSSPKGQVECVTT
ncbi:MAG: DNA polymerase elongation subunit [Candidatus Aenigmatarchaeota archaeon]|nr:MAG: DNA polymerase elongation subunit [Candidatus Aenigmarchaeota archaeon]